MSLADINTLKEVAATYQALVLAQIVASDGAVLCLSTSDISTYAGNTYFGRIISQNLGALQEMSSEGLDVMPNISLSIADADKAIYDWDGAHGICGSRINLVFVYYDQGSQFSADSYRVFLGRCTGGGADDQTFTFAATSLLNLSSKRLPATPVQMTCPNNHPDTPAQKALANIPGSLYYRCGDDNPAHTGCDRSKAGCVSNGMYALGRFSGFQWSPPLGIRTEKEYVSNTNVKVQSSANPAKYGDYMPLVYGVAWVQAVLNSVIPDGNSTRGEAIVADGEIFGIAEVLCDGEMLPPANDKQRNPYQVQDSLFRYNWVGNGTRDGVPCPDKGFDGQGDPAGSTVTIEYCIPRRNDNPTIYVLVQGLFIRVYTDPYTYTVTYSDNPVWILLDVLVRSGWSYADVDLASWVDAASWCDQVIPVTDMYGNPTTRKRYAASLVLRQRRTLADIVQGLRRGMNAIVNWGATSGLLEMYIKKTLADQQPTAPDGSAASSISSEHADGSAGIGYPAYDFRAYNTISLRRVQPAASIPNTFTIPFVNKDNNYSLDSAKIVDLDAITFDGQENNSNVVVDGPNSISHARAIGSVYLAEQRKGNARNDSKGSEVWEIQTTSKGIKLRIGQLIAVTSDKYSL